MIAGDPERCGASAPRSSFCWPSLLRSFNSYFWRPSRSRCSSSRSFGRSSGSCRPEIPKLLALAVTVLAILVTVTRACVADGLGI